MLKITTSNCHYGNGEYEGLDQVSFREGSVSADDITGFLDAYDIPHDSIVSVEPSYAREGGFLWIGGTKYAVSYDATDSSGNVYIVSTDGNGKSTVLLVPHSDDPYNPPAPINYSITDTPEEFSITQVNTGNDDTRYYSEHFDYEGHKIIEYSEPGKGYITCRDNGDGTVTTTMRVWDPRTKRYVDVDLGDYNGSVDGAFENAMSSYHQHQNYDLSKSSSFNSLFSGSGEGFGKSFDSAIDGLFFKSTHMADVFLDVEELRNYTNDISKSISEYKIDGTDITGFTGLETALKSALRCSRTSLPGSNGSRCLSKSMKDFVDQMARILDDTFMLEHANADAFDELDVDNINVELRDREGREYSNYSEYLLANNKTRSSTSVHTPGSFNADDLSNSFTRDITPFYAKTTAEGVINNENVKYTNEIKSNYTSAKVKDPNDSESVKTDDLSLTFGSDIKTSFSADYVYYSNSSTFEIFNSDGEVIRTDSSSLAVGKGSLSMEFKAGISDAIQGKGADALSFKLKGEGSLIEFEHKTTDVYNASHNFELNAKFLTFEGSVTVKLDNKFFGAMYSAFGRDGTGNTIENADTQSSVEELANSKLFHVDGEFQADVLRVKVKGNIETDHAIVGYEEEVSFLSGKWKTGKGFDGKYVRFSWPKLTFDWKATETARDVWTAGNQNNGEVDWTTIYI